jgi:hypothetical protein
MEGVGVKVHTFMPYCSFAISGLSDKNVKSLRRHVNGMGTTSATKMNISDRSRRNTCIHY